MADFTNGNPHLGGTTYFNHLIQIKDPEVFEAKKKELLEKYISSRPPKSQEKLRKTMASIENAERVSDPIKSAKKASLEMLKAFGKEQQKWEELVKSSNDLADTADKARTVISEIYDEDKATEEANHKI